ncbi:MAG: MFS transporter [Christensenellales bacterium]
MNKIQGFFGKVGGVFKSFVKHWNHPAEGRFVSNKEIVAYSVGGMGVQFMAALTAQITLSANCLLLGSIYGMTPMELTILLTINTVFTLLIQPLKSYWIDNVGANSKKNRGKARPFILWLGPPSAILITLFAFLPVSWATAHHTLLVVLVGALFLGMNFVYQFFYGMYIQLSQLITPNTTERADIISISSLVYSMAPTITGALFPLIAKAFKGGQLDIAFYRVIFPVFAIIGLATSLIAYFGTKERIVVPKTYQAKVKFKDGMKAIISNKYFWIINTSNWFTFARTAVTGCLYWSYVYMLQNEIIQSVVSLVIGTASGIGMAAAPFLIRAMGKKNVVIVSNGAVLLSSIVLIFFSYSYVMFTICAYIAFFGIAVQLITAPAMNAEALDYQQYLTGDRLEGFAGNFAIINSIIALGTNFVIPAIYTYHGLSDNYDVLFDTTIRTPMFRSLAILAAAGSILMTLPYLFWDLTEKKHGEIIEALKQRAIEANKAAGYGEDASFLSSDETIEELYEEEVTTDETTDAEVVETVEAPAEEVEAEAIQENAEATDEQNKEEE